MLAVCYAKRAVETSSGWLQQYLSVGVHDTSVQRDASVRRVTRTLPSLYLLIYGL